MLLLERGRPKEAWTTLARSDAIARSQDQHLAAALQIAVAAAIDTERWDELKALCERPETPATARLSGATALGSSGRKSTAVSILKATCGELSGEAKEVCTHNLKTFAQ